MTDGESILNDDEFFGDINDTSKEDIEQHKKRESLRSAISKGKVLDGKKQWTHKRIEKASDETINKTYAEYKQLELNKTDEKTGNALGKHFNKLYSTGIFQMVKIRDVKKLQQDIENDPIIKSQMANLGFLLVRIFDNFLESVIVAANTANNLDLGNEQGFENEGYDQTKVKKNRSQKNSAKNYLNKEEKKAKKDPYALKLMPD